MWVQKKDKKQKKKLEMKEKYIATEIGVRKYRRKVGRKETTKYL